MDTTREGLEFQSDKIESVFARHGIEARIEGGAVTPRAIIFNTSTELPIYMADDISAVLGVSDVRLDGNTITVKRADAIPVMLLSLTARLANENHIPPFTATLGMCDDGAPLLVRLTSRDVGHVLISGPNGCGKSSLLRTIAISLAVRNKPRALRLVLVGELLGDLAKLPHVLSYSKNLTDAITIIANLTKLLVHPDPRPPRVVIVADEIECLTASLERLVQYGHAAGVHVVASGNVSSAGFSTMITGNGDRGDFTAIAAWQELRFQAAYITPAEIEQVTIGALPKREPTRLYQAAMAVAD